MTSHSHHGPACFASDQVKVIDCEACGFKHMMPLPSETEIDQFYSEEFYDLDRTKYFQRAEEDKDWTVSQFSDRFEIFERFLETDRRNALDIGTGPGFFLDAGRNRNWTVTGIEPSALAVDYARSRNNQVIHSMFDSRIAEELSGFDVVHMSEVLEHVQAPIALLDNVKKVLKPGGLISISVPNDFNPLQQAATRKLHIKPWWVTVPHHINYFNFDSLETLLRKCNFQPIHRFSSYPMELFLLQGDNYIGNDSLGRKCHSKRKNLDAALAPNNGARPRIDFYESLGNAGLGRLAIVTAKLVL